MGVRIASACILSAALVFSGVGAGCTSGELHLTDGYVPDNAVHGSADTTCLCALSDVCNEARECVPRPTGTSGEVVAQLDLLQQVSPRESDTLGRFAYATASFHTVEAPPIDTRPSFATDEGETCSFEVGSNYPASYGGQVWPTTPGLDAGRVTIAASGAAGPIELEPDPLSSVRARADVGYFHDTTPPGLKGGGVSFPDFFDPAYLPPGRNARIVLDGGPDVERSSVVAEIPSAFTVTSPAIESAKGSGVTGAALPVAWTPAEPSGYMEILVTAMKDNELALLSCKVRDDGAVSIPASAMAPFSGDIGIQLRRTTERYTRVTQANGKVVHAFVRGRHARLGTLTLSSP